MKVTQFMSDNAKNEYIDNLTKDITGQVGSKVNFNLLYWTRSLVSDLWDLGIVPDQLEFPDIKIKYSDLRNDGKNTLSLSLNWNKSSIDGTWSDTNTGLTGGHSITNMDDIHTLIKSIVTLL